MSLDYIFKYHPMPGKERVHVEDFFSFPRCKKYSVTMAEDEIAIKIEDIDTGELVLIRGGLLDDVLTLNATARGSADWQQVVLRMDRRGLSRRVRRRLANVAPHIPAKIVETVLWMRGERAA